MKKMRIVFLLFLLLLFIYSCLRLAFYFLYFNADAQPAALWYWGVRMDFIILFVVNTPFLLYLFIIYDLLPKRTARIIAVALLSVIHIPLLAINFIDLVYYRHQLRRSNTDLLYVWRGSIRAITLQWSLYAGYVFAFACTAVLFAAVTYILLKNVRAQRFRTNVVQLTMAILAGGMLARGFSDKPVLPSAPLLYFEARYQPLVSNSSLSFLYSLFKRERVLEEKKYFTPGELDAAYTISRKYGQGVFERKNVIVFIMESMPKEYLEAGDPLKCITPFLDSVMNNSIVCENAFANGFQSNQGIVAILGGIPSMFDMPFYYSSYNNDKFDGIGTLLKKEGYAASFFMGTEYDHFGFTKFSRMVGIDQYYSRETYNNEKDFNGSWGINDHKFLPYAADILSQNATPFFSVVYNLSTHPPFTIPGDMQPLFAVKGQNKAQQSVSYYDYSLRLFFDRIKKLPWYEHSVFVFCSDHSSGAMMGKGISAVGTFSIPFFVHMPGRPGKTVVRKAVQQLDVVPTVLDILHYPEKFMSFGSSIFDSGSRYIVNRYFDNYQVSDSAFILGYNEERESVEYLYNYKKDMALKTDLVADRQYSDTVLNMKKAVRAFIQRYNNSLSQNQLEIK